MNDYEGLIGAGDGSNHEGVGGVHRRHPLEVDISAAELWADVIDVVRHPTQDGVHRGLGGVSPFSVVAGDLLNPFQVGDRHNADQQIHHPLP